MNDANPASEPIALAQRSSTVIDVRSVQCHYGLGTDQELLAMGPLDLQVADGEFLCLVGPSGCGKATLLRVVAGLVRPSSGEVAISVSGKSPHPIAMVFQDYGIYPWKSVLENVRFGLDLVGVPKAEGNDKAMDWLERLGLSAFAGRLPSTLSGGMRQRVAIARALVVDPEIVLMDEPFAALDAQLRHLLQDELLELWQSKRRTVILVTHSLEEAAVLGDRVVVMTARPGRILRSVEVPFGRPRGGDVRSTLEFNAFHNELWEHLRGEVEATMEGFRK